MTHAARSECGMRWVCRASVGCVEQLERRCSFARGLVGSMATQAEQLAGCSLHETDCLACRNTLSIPNTSSCHID